MLWRFVAFRLSLWMCVRSIGTSHDHPTMFLNILKKNENFILFINPTFTHICGVMITHVCDV
jgi:hypothetical protein